MKIRYLLSLMILISGALKAQFITNTGISINNSSLLSTNGEWTNADGSVVVNNGTIEIQADFINDGLMEPSGNGGFILKGETDYTFKPNGGVGFLVKNQNSTVTVDGAFLVKDSLSIYEGVLNIPDDEDTLLINASTVVKATPGAYVDGQMGFGGSGTITFPVGRDGYLLPITLHKVNASKVMVVIVPFPSGVSAGAGVDSLVNFPFMWEVFEKSEADTAAHVQLTYPTTLVNPASPIVVRRSGNEFVSMGARLKEEQDENYTVKSYSRNLNGSYSIAAGFPHDVVTDSLALVALYTSTNGPGWTNNTSWTSAPMDNWFGVTRSGQTITTLQLTDNNLSGAVPDQLTDILGLEVLDLSGNSLSFLPDFTVNPDITALNVSRNKLTFESLEPNALVPGFVYSDQGEFGQPVDSLVEVGSSYTFVIDAGGQHSEYVWKRNDVPIDASSSDTLILQSVVRSNMGEYRVEVTNELLPDLTLRSEIQRVLAYASVSGKVFIADAEANQGNVTLYKVQPGAFQPVDTVEIGDNGSFSFPKAILDDYQLLAFADTLTYEDALPTYYKNTIFWEEADTLVLTTHVDTIDIVSNQMPSPPSGHGTISGYLEEDDGTGGRTKDVLKTKRVSSAGVSVRRVQNTGRGKDVKLTLVAYVFTDEEGLFNIANLPEADYLLNIQYPGYPMDTTTDVRITIGSGISANASVAANVIDGKIKVYNRPVTGVQNIEGYSVQAYPNPARGSLHLKFARENAGRTIEMLDLTGKCILRSPAGGFHEIISLQQTPEGLYLLNVREKDKIVRTIKVAITE